MEILQGVWKLHLKPRAVVGYGVKIFLPSPPNYVTSSPGRGLETATLDLLVLAKLFLRRALVSTIAEFFCVFPVCSQFFEKKMNFNCVIL